MNIRHIPGAQQDRRALLLLVSDDRQLLLCGTCCGDWTIPSIHLGTDDEPAHQARTHLTQAFGINNPRLAAVRGVHTSSRDQGWEYERVTQTHVLIFRMSNAEARSAYESGSRHTLWTLDDLRRHRRRVTPQGGITLLAGFLEGWLPDGSHTLY
ncbi:hypothetical protein [Streptomyces sp. CL12]|uniref:hypothetical protein n=1 Tax=Streptomyces sp. CL12 TaxID=3391744 RepID=UPI003A80D765